MKATGSLLLMLILSGSVFAQDAAMADVMRENGKIYVVVGVIVLIFAVLFIYLFLIDRRLRKLEQKSMEK